MNFKERHISNMLAKGKQEFISAQALMALLQNPTEILIGSPNTPMKTLSMLMEDLSGELMRSLLEGARLKKYSLSLRGHMKRKLLC
jgi:predicted translin family RNA/ssDNA-binding protein